MIFFSTFLNLTMQICCINIEMKVNSKEINE